MVGCKDGGIRFSPRERWSFAIAWPAVICHFETYHGRMRSSIVTDHLL
jgi:hypothetical protein